MTYNIYDLVALPFPFSNLTQSKIRPCVVISSPNYAPIPHTLTFAMITSSTNTFWPLDLPIQNLESAGLNSPSFIRMKIHTIDVRHVITKIGQLSEIDKTNLHTHLNSYFQLSNYAL